MTKARNLSDLLDANGKVDNDDIANIDASKIISGDIAAARLTLATETKPTVSSVSPSTITNDATNITITGQDFTAIPRVDIINTATGIWYSANTVTHNSATQLTVNVTLPVDAGTYRIRVENPDGLAGLSSANFLTVSDAPTWTTGAGSLGSVLGNTNGAVATVAATGDTIVYSEVTNVLTNASLANCSLNSSTGAITSTDFDGSSTSPRTHTFTIRATDAQGQTTDREFSLTSVYFTGTAYYLVVAGGGGGGSSRAGSGSGGGGAGGYRTNFGGSAYTLGQGVTYTVTVGLGGVHRTHSQSHHGGNGGNSSFTGSDITDIVSTGGGGGGYAVNSGVGANGSSGGSGGGAGGSNGGVTGSTGGAGNTPSTSPSQGNSGGNVTNGGGYGAGGGGSGAAGDNGSATAGGVGTSNSITGSAVTYAAGGTANSGAGVDATDGTGNGGTGAGQENTSGTGGDGVVILRIATSDYNEKTGITGTYTASAVGSDTVVKWTASGNISF